MRSRSRSRPVTDARPTAAEIATQHAEPLPDELEARIAALERADLREDFDRTSWIWMLLFGVALPAGLVYFGWRL
jgi:hypothetical protein